MKSIMISLVFVASFASASTLKNLPMVSEIKSGFCNYHGSLEFSEFPDVEIFSINKDGDTIQKASDWVNSSIKFLGGSRYQLNVVAIPGTIANDGACESRSLKLLIR